MSHFVGAQLNIFIYNKLSLTPKRDPNWMSVGQEVMAMKRYPMFCKALGLERHHQRINPECS